MIQPDFLNGNGADRKSYGGETGQMVVENFEYRSDTNDLWISVDDLGDIIG